MAALGVMMRHELATQLVAAMPSQFAARALEIADCINDNRFSRVVGGVAGPLAESVTAVFEYAGPISLVLDLEAMSRKRAGKPLGPVGDKASGVNRVARRVIAKFWPPGKPEARATRKRALQWTRRVGDKAPAVAVPAAFTLGYNSVVEVKCLTGAQ